MHIGLINVRRCQKAQNFEDKVVGLQDPCYNYLPPDWKSSFFLKSQIQVNIFIFFRSFCMHIHRQP